MSVSPNTNFVLNVDDIELIESALRVYSDKYAEEAPKIYQLLGSIHNQKNWYRPKKTYISG
jgi:siderophore synthetase component